MSDCNVCLDQSDGDCCAVWTTAIITARKAHQCYECSDPIPVGARYQKITTLYDKRWDTYQTCLACVEVHRAMSSCDREDGKAGYRMLGVLWDDLIEYVFPDLTMACIARCETTAAREKLLARWNDWKFR